MNQCFLPLLGAEGVAPVPVDQLNHWGGQAGLVEGLQTYRVDNQAVLVSGGVCCVGPAEIVDRGC